MKPQHHIVSKEDVVAARAAAPKQQVVTSMLEDGDPYECFRPVSQEPTRTLLIDPGTYSTSGLGLDEYGAITRFYEYNQSALVTIKGHTLFGKDAIAQEWSLPKDTEIAYPFKNGIIEKDGSAEKLLDHVVAHLKHSTKWYQWNKTNEIIISVPSGDHTSLHLKEMRAYAKKRGFKIRAVKQSVAGMIGGGFTPGSGRSALGIDGGGGTILVTLMSSDGEIIAEKSLLDHGGTTINTEIVDALAATNTYARTDVIEQIKRLVASGETSGGKNAPYIEPAGPNNNNQAYVVFMGKFLHQLKEQSCKIPLKEVENAILRNALKTGRAVHGVVNQLLGKPHLQDHLDGIFEPGGLILSGGALKVAVTREEVAKQLQMEIPEVKNLETRVLHGMHRIVQLGLLDKFEVKMDEAA